MKVNINNECGNRLIAVLKSDGSPAVEGEDFVLWEGKYHKNGKWSYSEGGVALRDGIVVWNLRSTHRSADNTKRCQVVIDNESHGYMTVMGRFSETPEKPPCPKGITPPVWEAVLNAICDWGKPDVVAAMKEQWRQMEKFA